MERENDRDTLIRVEQQLKDSVQNQSQILENQREIFQKLERESKQLTILNGEVKGHLDASKIRWEELEKKLQVFEKRVADNERAVQKGKDDLEEEVKERIKFDQGIEGGARMAKWIAVIFGTIATVISAIAGLATLLKGMG